MNMNRLFAQLIAITLLVLLIVTVVKFIVPMIRLKISANVSRRRSFILAGIYLGILMILVPILYLLPNQGFVKLGENRNQAEMTSQNTITNLFNDLPLKGDFDKLPGIFKNSSHKFKVDTKKLVFMFNSYPGNYQFFVQRKDIDDGEIEVSTYVATHSAGNIDFTKLVLPPVISYENGTLSFKLANQRLDLNQFKPDFTVAQFKNINMGLENGFSSRFGAKIIYICVPKSLEIDKGKYNGQIKMLNGA